MRALVRRAAISGPLLIASFLPLGDRGPTRHGDLPSRFLLGGTQVHEADPQHWARALRDAGMNTVAVTVYARQGAWDGEQLDYAAEEPAVIEEVRAARGAGHRVVLVLRVALDQAVERNRFLWHGMILPRSEAALRGWFRRYGGFVRQWAAIAEAEDVDVLGIGSELNAMTSTLPLTRLGLASRYHGWHWYQRALRDRSRAFADRLEPRHLWVRGAGNYPSLDSFLDDRFDRAMAWARQVYLRDDWGRHAAIHRRRALIDSLWIRLIDDVRTVYSGGLTYGANFDSYREVGFWHRLDLIGINSYFPLRPHLDRELGRVELLHALGLRWEQIFRHLGEFKHRHGLDSMPVVFTEIGYTFRRHSTVEPWNHDGFSVVGWGTHRRRLVVWGEQPPDPEERALALEALRRVRDRVAPDLAGLLYWKLSTDPQHAEIEPFTLHVGPGSSDPALPVLRRFLDSPRAPTAVVSAAARPLPR